MLQFPNTNVLIFKLIFTTSFIKEVSKEHDESAAHDDWKSGTLLYLRQHFFIPFEALTLISHSMEENYGRKLICLKVGKKTVSTILIVYHKSMLF